MSFVAEKYSPVGIGTEVLQTKFYRLAKEHFQITARNDYDYLNGVKESIRFFSLDLPAEIKEIFIPFSEAPIFWIYESSLLSQIEEFMKFNLVKGSYGELNKSIKENYSRWVTTKLKSEKDYYATTTINFIERDINKHNFFKLIIKAIIQTYQSTFYNPVKALENLESAMEIVNSLRMNDQTKNEIKYVLQLYTGFVHLKEMQYEKANQAFKSAVEVKQQGCTAKIYCALTELNIGNEDVVLYYLRDVFNYDIHRLSLAINTNNTGMFSYFFRNAFFYNVFHEKEFLKAFNIIDQILSEYRATDNGAFVKCKSKLEKVMLKRYDEYFDDEMKKTIVFMEKIILNYSNAMSTMFFAVFPELQNKLDLLVKSIVEKIRAMFYAEVKEALSTYDVYIQENMNAEKHLADELENFKVRSKENLAESIQMVNQDFENESKAIEERIKDLPNVDRYNPRVSFSNNMTYNIIIAFIVFFIGGVAGYSNRMVADTSEFNSILTYILISGSKWGAISFIVGVIISIVVSGVIVVERMDVKQKLLRKLNYLKLEREKTIADLKENAVQKEKIMTESFNNGIVQHRNRVAELKQEKELREKELTRQADEKINAATKELTELLSAS